MAIDGYEQREFERDEQDQRDLDYVEALYDRADTPAELGPSGCIYDHYIGRACPACGTLIDGAQAAMVAHFLGRVLP
jgi:hypothetical protein